MTQTQYETVLTRINDTKIKAESGITEKTAKLFDGMDEKMISAAKKLKAYKDPINANRGLNPEGRETQLREAEAKYFEPVKQTYLDAVQQAKQSVLDAIEEIQSASLPQTDTGAERAANIALWQFEVNQAKPGDWKSLYAEHADDRDYMKLLEIAAKNNTSTRDALMAASTEKSTATQSKTLSKLQRLFNTLTLGAYAYGLPAHIRNVGTVQDPFLDVSPKVDMIMWNNLLNYDSSRMPQSAK